MYVVEIVGPPLPDRPLDPQEKQINPNYDAKKFKLKAEALRYAEQRIQERCKVKITDPDGHEWKHEKIIQMLQHTGTR